MSHQHLTTGPAIDPIAFAEKPHPFVTHNSTNPSLVPSKAFRTYRLVLHSADRLAVSSTTQAEFNTGNLAGRWRIPQNVDGSKVLYHVHVKSFKMACSTAVPSIVEILGSHGFAPQGDSWDSKTGNASCVLAHAGGSLTAWTDSETDDGVTLSAVPTGLIGIQLRSRDQQVALDADSTLTWSLILSVTPFVSA
jgi:hypothetical protein